MTRLLASAAALAFVMLIYWLGGGNFERGFILAYITFVGACGAFLTFIAPFWEQNK